MKYQEKKEKAAFYADQILKGRRLEEIKQELKEEGFYPPDIRSLERASKEIANESIGSEIRDQMLGNEVEKDYKELLDEEVYHFISRKQERKIRKLCMDRINSMLDLGFKLDKIADTPIINDYFSLDDLKKQYNFYQKKGYRATKAKKKGNYIAGTIKVIVGILLSYFSYQSGNFSLVYPLFIIGGIVIIGRAYALEAEYYMEY